MSKRDSNSNLSVIILTHNEEGMIAQSIQSVIDIADVHVVDSGSTDKTLAIAKGLGTYCYEHSFESFGEQRNWALDNCVPLKEWILFIDADEVTTKAFKEKVQETILKTSDAVAGFYLCNKLMLNQKWLRYSSGFPTWQFRLMRKGRARFTDFGHGQKEGEVDGRLEYIHEPYEHYSFYKGWDHWHEKHEKYARKEAKARLNTRISMADCFRQKGSQRNMALKVWLSRVPFWPELRFFLQYVIKRGFMDGKEGRLYCKKMYGYERCIMEEIKRLR